MLFFKSNRIVHASPRGSTPGEPTGTEGKWHSFGFGISFFFLRGGGSCVLETTLVDQRNIEDLYFQSLGISEQASNAPGQFH